MVPLVEILLAYAREYFCLLDWRAGLQVDTVIIESAPKAVGKR